MTYLLYVGLVEKTVEDVIALVRHRTMILNN